MKNLVLIAAVSLLCLVFSADTSAQADDVCREFGETPTRESNRGRLVPYVYGKISLKGVDPEAKPPRVIVIYSDTQQPATRQQIDKSGNYCFKRQGNSGTLVIEIDGVEAARKNVSDIGGTRQREDFEIYAAKGTQTAPPAVVSTKFFRAQNGQTIELYRKTADAEKEQHAAKAVEYVNQILSIDPDDFVAWAKLGSLYLGSRQTAEAEAAFKRSVLLRPDYTPALLNLGIIRAVQNRYGEAIELFKRAVVSDPESARGYRLLGEAYLQDKQGSLGLAALDEALRLDPVGMAECHLLKARLYDLAGAKQLATREYKAFLARVPDYSDKKKLEKYIRDNPE